MTRQNQIIAIEKGARGEAEGMITRAYHVLQKTVLLNGIARSYIPQTEDGDQLPPESTLVQVRASDEINKVTEKLSRMFDVVATREKTNTVAKASVVVDGDTLISEVPANVLLFLEKQLVDIVTFIRKLPTLDPAETWHYDSASDCYVTEPTQTTRTKKIPKNHVLAAATDKHPAQVQMYHEDVVAGTWTTRKFSGALEVRVVSDMLARVQKLQAAVKMAREEANTCEAVDLKIGDKVLGYVFAA